MQRILFLLYTLSIVLYLSSPAFAQPEEAEDEMKVLRMFYKENDLVETASRYPKPISQVAENITIVTAAEIEAINAHTLSDVLNYIPGVQLEIQGGPGSITNAHIQGSDSRHVLVMIDGVALNNLSDNFADISAIPVQQIKRVEIVKGPASSSWGSSLGGVINVITKSADDARRFGGTASASIGERNTGDYRGEVSGRTGALGYYLYTGKLLSDGLTPGTSFDGNNLYTKLHWSASEGTGLLFTLGYTSGSRGVGVFGNNDFDHLFTTLALNHALTDDMDMNLSLRTLNKSVRLGEITADDLNIGGSAKLNWRLGVQNLLLGADYDNGELKTPVIRGGEQRLEKWALFANDTIAISGFSFTPGVRYDHTNTNNDFFSPSIGVTYTVVDHTILRGYAARGFNIPPLANTFAEFVQEATVDTTTIRLVTQPNPDLKVERVWSYAVGLESALLKQLWLKTTLFRHDISDAIDIATSFEALPDGSLQVTRNSVNSGKQRRQGIEVEMRTAPVYNTTLLAGYVFTEAKNRDTGERIPDVARHTYDIGLQYNDRQSFSGELRGHYIKWDADASHNSLICDLYLAKKLFSWDERAVETFFSARNIFNSSQFLDPLFKTPGRWFEGGVRFRF
jgi:vitamin B12 transporter